jgi:hypothetical protein
MGKSDVRGWFTIVQADNYPRSALLDIFLDDNADPA